MKDVFIGRSKDNNRISLAEEDRSRHMHVIGSTGTGKSKFLEWMIREDIKAGNGLCLIDPHGDLYDAILSWCAYNNYLSSREIILLNPSSGGFVTGFNPFSRSSGDDEVSTQVSRRIDVTLKAWGVESSDQTPTLERWLRCIYYTLIEKDLSLVEAQYLISFQRVDVLRYLTAGLSDPLIVDEWKEIDGLQTSKQFRDEFLSTKNRLFRLLTNKPLLRFMGQKDHNLDFADIMDSGKILLVNLNISKQLDEKTATLFGTLLVNQLFEVAQRRSRGSNTPRPRPFYLYLDEFQKFATPDIDYILAQGRKMGLHLVLAHQNLSQVDEKMDQGVLLTNARTKVVFGGLNHKDAEIMVEEMFANDLDLQEMKEAVTQTKFWPVYDRDKVITKGNSTTRMSGQSSGTMSVSGTTSGWGQAASEGFFAESGPRTEHHSTGFTAGSSAAFSEGWADSEMEAVSDVPVYRPVPFEESTESYSLEEQKWRMAGALKEQWTRHCFIKILDQKSQPMVVPRVYDPPIFGSTFEEYQQKLMVRSPYSLTLTEASTLIEERQKLLLKEASKAQKRADYPEDEGFIEK